jgi:hypothetical protein
MVVSSICLSYTVDLSVCWMSACSGEAFPAATEVLWSACSWTTEHGALARSMP